MGLSTALFNGVSGLNTISQSLNVIGDNLANVNTVGFKSSSALFETVFSQTLSGATVPTGNLLGTNPVQLGLGTTLASIDKDFTQGSLNSTGNLSDLAIQGRGFFILSDGQDQAFTRDGTFALAVDGTLVDPATGLRVQGWTAVNNVVTPTGDVGDIVVPIGMSIVQETSNAFLLGNFDASGDISTTGNILLGPVINDGGVAATGASLLTNLQDAALNPLNLQVGDVITITGQKGGADITTTFTVQAGSDVNALMTAIQTDFGIADTGSVAIVGGQIQITGDLGPGNAISNVVMSATDATGTVARTDFDNVFNPGGATGFTETLAADGESFVLSGLTVFDSLGNEVPLNLTFTRTGTNEVRYLAESPLGTSVGMGTITYDNDGQFVSVDNAVINIDRTAFGSVDPLDITLDFSTTSFLSGENTLAMSSQDGFPIGSLEEFYVGINGIVTGAFSNGLTLTLGQVALAVFANQEGLSALGDNLFFTSANSGDPIIGTPGTAGRGTTVQGYLEGSNTDLASEFTDIIIAQRGFQANARTITAADTLLEEVISLVR